jgi:hypothetical protein
VKLAFQKLLRTPPRPDRFANAANGRALPCFCVQKILPCRNDPGGIATQLVHVDKFHVLRSVC